MEKNNVDIYEFINKIKINIEINWNNYDVEGYNTPPSYFKSIPLNSYLYYYINDINNFYDNYIQKITQHEIWFEYENKPLKWNLPFGISLELLGIKISEVLNPLKITINFRNYPLKIIGPLKGDSQLQNFFLHSYKEAKLIEYEDKDILFSNINPKEIELIKKSVKEGNYQNYKQLCSNLDTNSKFIKKNYPIKFFFVENEMYLSKKIKIDDDLTWIKLIKKIFPNGFTENGELKEEFKHLKVINNGVILDLNFKLKEVYNNFKFYDSFLYLIINFN